MNDQLLKEILSELKTLNQRVGHIENDVAGVKNDVNDLKTGQARLEANYSRLEEGLNRLEANQNRLELRIENEVIEKIRALFDARQVHEEKINMLTEGQEDIKAGLNYLVARAASLEKLAR